MKRMFLFYFFLISTLIGSVEMGCEDGKYFKKTAFYNKIKTREAANIQPFSAIPNCKLALPVENYEAVVREVIRWNKRALQEKYFPSESYTRRNLKLFKASELTYGNDMAFLEWKVDSQELIMAQTGGDYVLFIKDTLRKKAVTEEDVCDFITFVEKNIISLKIVNELDKRYRKIIQYDSIFHEKIGGPATFYFCLDNQLCFSVVKSSFDVKNAIMLGVAPVGPYWFDYLMTRKIPEGFLDE